ncbi:MAG: cysteine synthase A [Breznakia sp.]
MSKIYDGITDLIGNTPLVKIKNMDQGRAKILAKLESFNPGGSVKDRIAYNMIQDGLQRGVLDPKSTLIEATSGNTGIGLAMVCAALHMRLIIVMPESMSIERRKLIQAYGAKLILTPANEGMKGALSKVEKLQEDIENAYILKQFENPANPEAHFQHTGVEIFEDTDGNVDILVSAVGSAGTISGAGLYLKQQNPDIKVVAVEAKKSAVLSGNQPGPHKIQGISAGFIPHNYDDHVVDEIIQVDDDDAIKTARAVAKREGISVGISSGAALYAALQLSKKTHNKDKNIVVILADTGERYLSTSLFDFAEIA